MQTACLMTGYLLTIVTFYIHKVRLASGLLGMLLKIQDILIIFDKDDYIQWWVLLLSIFLLFIKVIKLKKYLGLRFSSLTGTTRTTVVVARSESSNRGSDLDTGKVLKVDSLKQSLMVINKNVRFMCFCKKILTPSKNINF